MDGNLRGARALLLGSGLTAIATMRLLRRQGMKVEVLPTNDRLTRSSRFYRPLGHAPEAGEQLAQLLARLPDRYRGTVLLPCSDSWLQAVVELPPELRRVYPVCIAGSEAIRTLTDKMLFGQKLAALSLPHPRTVRLSNIEDLLALPDSAFSHSFLKPADSQRFFAKFGRKALHFSGRSDAERQYQSCIDAGLEMVLQEYVPGPATSHYYVEGFIDRDGITRAEFSRQRCRMYPPDFGNSTLMVSVAPEVTARASATLRTLLAELNYRGIYSAEFKRDETTDEMKLLEVNARPWWYVEFAYKCGINFCAMAARDALGMSVQTVAAYRTSQRCVYPYYDIFAAMEARKRGELKLASWMRSWIGASQPLFSWDDPGPALHELLRVIGARFR